MSSLQYVKGGCGPSVVRYPEVIPGYEAAREWAQPIAPKPGEIAVRVEAGNALFLSTWRIGPEANNTRKGAAREQMDKLVSTIQDAKRSLEREKAALESRPESASRNIQYLSVLLSRYSAKMARLAAVADGSK